MPVDAIVHSGNGNSHTSKFNSVTSIAAKVLARTWIRDMHGLFDFEAAAENVHMQTFECNDPYAHQFTRKGHEIHFHTDLQPTPFCRQPLCSEHPVDATHGEEHLVQLTLGPQGLCIGRSRKRMRPHTCWILCRGQTRHKLAEDDVLKFGRAQFRVRALIATSPPGGKVAIPVQDHSEPVNVDPAKLHEHSNTMCRICLMEGSSEEDPLIAPCKCTGSVEHVHVGCLKHWLKERLKIPEEGSFVYKAPLCELCKSDYRMKVRLADKVIDLVELPMRSPPLVILESCSDRRLHVLSASDDKPIKIGRAHDCAMSVAETSVSRTQALISVQDGEFWLSDTNNSRFGTFVKMRRGNICLQPGQDVSIQVGRTLLDVSTPIEPDSVAGQVELPSTQDVRYHDALSEELQPQQSQSQKSSYPPEPSMPPPPPPAREDSKATQPPTQPLPWMRSSEDSASASCEDYSEHVPGMDSS